MYPERVLKALQRAKANINAGDATSAVEDLEKVVQKVPKAFDGWFLMGQAKGMLGDHAGAEICFKQAAVLQPKNPAAWSNLGMSCSIRGMFAEALKAYTRSLSVSPSPHPDTLHNVGSCYIQLDRYDEAIAVFRELLRVKDNSDVWALLGIAYQGIDRYQDALNAYLKARERGGGGYTLNLNIGTCYDTLGDYESAANHARAALTCQPDDGVALYNLGAACFAMGMIEEAIDAFSRSSLPSARQSCLLAMNYLDRVDPVELRIAHEDIAGHLGVSGEPLLPVRLEAGQRLRIGFVSADFREHPVAYFLEGLLSHLDRSRLEVFAYSDVRSEDAVTARFRPMVEHWRDMSGRDDGVLAEAVKADQVHVLIDLAGHTNGSRLTAFARRLAPVQASYLGYSATTGLPRMDYLLADEVLAPEGVTDSHYSEKVLRMGRLFASYTPPPINIDVSPSPLKRNGYPTFASFAQLRKISPATIAMWIDALQAVPHARLQVMSKGLENAGVQERLLKPFVDAGLDRSRFVLRGAGSMEEFLAAHHDIDVILDTVPWNGHTTTLHGLWMGVPTITVEGATHIGRFGKLVAEGAGLHGFVTTASGFGNCAAAVVSDGEKLAGTRERLRESLLGSELCNHQGMASRFENACFAMWNECVASTGLMSTNVV